MTEYAVGFAFDDDGRVALIRKNRPAWQEGRLNGIGGHVEEGENPDDTMVREFEEETGVRLEGWKKFVRMSFPGAVIHFYKVRTSADVLGSLETVTDEEVVVHERPFSDLIIPNLTWLIPLAAYADDEYDCIDVQASVATVLGG